MVNNAGVMPLSKLKELKVEWNRSIVVNIHRVLHGIAAGRLAMRQSRSVVANKLIDVLNQPLIATSANISSRPTCRSGIDVFGMMDGRVDLVLDGGTCAGTGATTVDITEPYWKLIREGAIPEKEIAACLKPA